jgi:hypothetical protein
MGMLYTQTDSFENQTFSPPLLDLNPTQRTALVVPEMGKKTRHMEVVATGHRVPPITRAVTLTYSAECLLQLRTVLPTKQTPHEHQRLHNVLAESPVHSPGTTIGLHHTKRTPNQNMQLSKRESWLIPNKHIPLGKEPG